LYIPEADFEYLIRTLSDARSRATELAVSIGSRLGTEHRLAQLANSAAASIESTLRQVRNPAVDKLDSAAAGLAVPLAPVLETHTPSPIAPPPIPASFSGGAGLDPEHWLSAFVDELLVQARSSGGITFEGVERLLQQRKDEFLRDFLTARRMYRAYPHLFPEIAEARQVGTS
jgi:hypothetical protein